MTPVEHLDLATVLKVSRALSGFQLGTFALRRMTSKLIASCGC